jgi:hypothetical protein
VLELVTALMGARLSRQAGARGYRTSEERAREIARAGAARRAAMERKTTVRQRASPGGQRTAIRT